MQEQTRQQEQMTKIKEYEVHLEQMKVEQKRVEGEQKREYLKEEAKVAKHKAEYQVRTLLLCLICEISILKAHKSFQFWCPILFYDCSLRNTYRLIFDLAKKLMDEKS